MPQLLLHKHVVQCSACDLKVATSILDGESGSALSITLAKLYELLSSAGLFDHLFYYISLSLTLSPPHNSTPTTTTTKACPHHNHHITMFLPLPPHKYVLTTPTTQACHPILYFYIVDESCINPTFTPHTEECIDIYPHYEVQGSKYI